MHCVVQLRYTTVQYAVSYTDTCTGRAPLQKARRVGLQQGVATPCLEIVKFYRHRHRETFCVYYGYFSEELKERNEGRLKHNIAVFLGKAVVAIGGKNVRA